MYASQTWSTPFLDFDDILTATIQKRHLGFEELAASWWGQLQVGGYV